MEHELQGGRTLGLDPCGFCGRDSNVAGCLTQLQKEKKGGMTVVSTCPYRHETLKYKAAQNFDREAALSSMPYLGFGRAENDLEV
ncbi:hypothetical protein BKA70DRAFT_1126646 [Coprinopsis sp. MPI-PUGE-AT-0042]|nr:hypothetical protein BKA70DRAFT_1126646 [Coprinopsis sp. MPI-PUGE-AT-0042]